MSDRQSIERVVACVTGKCSRGHADGVVLVVSGEFVQLELESLWRGLQDWTYQIDFPTAEGLWIWEGSQTHSLFLRHSDSEWEPWFEGKCRRLTAIELYHLANATLPAYWANVDERSESITKATGGAAT